MILKKCASGSEELEMKKITCCKQCRGNKDSLQKVHKDGNSLNETKFT